MGVFGKSLLILIINSQWFPPLSSLPQNFSTGKNQSEFALQHTVVLGQWFYEELDHPCSGAGTFQKRIWDRQWGVRTGEFSPG